MLGTQDLAVFVAAGLLLNLTPGPDTVYIVTRTVARGRRAGHAVRVVAAGECGTRAVLGAATSPLATGEQPLARQLLPKLSPGDLLLADRNFLSHGLLADVLAAGVHVLWRAKSDVDLPVLQVLPDGTYLSRIADPAASPRLRRKGASGGDIPGITVRVIEYSVASEDGRPCGNRS